jgi:hypothetical protein
MLWMLTGLSAAAGDIDVGLGLRNSFIEENMLDGGRLIVRLNRGAWAGEASLYGALTTERISSLDHVLVSIASASGSTDYTRTVGVDRASVAGMLSHRIAPPADGTDGGPALYLGGELSQQALYTVAYVDEDQNSVTDAGTRLVAAPIAGVGLEARVERISGRFAVLDRMRIIDGEVDHDPTLTLDVMWRL